MTVVTLVVALPQEDVFGNKMARIVSDSWKSQRMLCFEIKMAQVVTKPRDCLIKTYLENKMALLEYVVEDIRRSAKREDRYNMAETRPCCWKIFGLRPFKP